MIKQPFDKPPDEEELAAEASTPQKHVQKAHDRPVARRLPLLALIRYYLPARIHHPVIKTARRVGRIWEVDGADWHWMANNPLPLKSLNRSLWRTAEPSFNPTFRTSNWHIGYLNEAIRITAIFSSMVLNS